MRDGVRSVLCVVVILFAAPLSSRAQESIVPAQAAVESDDSSARKERGRGRGAASEGQPIQEHSAPLLLTPQQKTQVMDFLSAHLPKLGEEMESLAGSNPRQYEREMAFLLPRISRLLRERDSDPVSFDLSVKIEQADLTLRRKLRRYHNVDNQKQREAIKVEVRSLLEERFDLEQLRSLRQLEVMEQRLTLLRRQLENRTSEKADVVTKELEERLSMEPNPSTPPRNGATDPPK